MGSIYFSAQLKRHGRLVVGSLRLSSLLQTATATALPLTPSATMIGLVNYLRKYLHEPPIKPPASEFRISDICFHSTTFKNPCFPMAAALLNANRTPPAARIPHTEYAADDRSSRKVKFLCSFGGKIMPRQSDGALSYVGGLTRIIAVRRDSTFNELCSKMEDAYGGPVVINYQLPDQEDLESLVCVSCAEDMENMMEEYDRLSQASGDRSAKLRVFLSSPFDMESHSEPAFEADPRRAHREAKMKNVTFKLNSDAEGDGFINEDTSTTNLLAALYASRFVENDSNSELEYERFPAHLSLDCTTNVATQTVNQPSVGNNIASTSKAPHQEAERYGLDPLQPLQKEQGLRLEKFEMRQKAPIRFDHFGADRMNFIPMETLEEEDAQSFGPSQPVQMGLFGDAQTSFAAPLVNTSQLDHVTSLEQQQQQWSQKSCRRV
ncbi:uncharacterized protein LOC114581373 isoform X2 [Dendrobium catenatum]|uniref:uncharacterized protein LOC114581373 isoform X2 n=1 Tax=Dendrobium catenatum TaxID=906689 RepID=UPI00109F2ED3|nr:uncharacterized protein LOC114581373 isoform X2 [Dendrobium catenatum]